MLISHEVDTQLKLALLGYGEGFSTVELSGKVSNLPLKLHKLLWRLEEVDTASGTWTRVSLCLLRLLCLWRVAEGMDPSVPARTLRMGVVNLRSK